MKIELNESKSSDDVPLVFFWLRESNQQSTWDLDFGKWKFWKGRKYISRGEPPSLICIRVRRVVTELVAQALLHVDVLMHESMKVLLPLAKCK